MQPWQDKQDAYYESQKKQEKCLSNREDMCRSTQTLYHTVDVHDSLGRLYLHTDSGVCAMWCMHVCLCSQALMN